MLQVWRSLLNFVFDHPPYLFQAHFRGKGLMDKGEGGLMEKVGLI